MLKEWEELPEFMRVPEVKPYYDILKEKQLPKMPAERAPVESTCLITESCRMVCRVTWWSED